MSEVQNKEPGALSPDDLQLEPGVVARLAKRLSRLVLVLKSPLTRKLVAFIFVAILLIEFIILLPSYLRK